MNQEQLLQKFREWSDDQILKEYAQIDEYEQVAADAIVIVLKEKGLWAQLEKQAFQELERVEAEQAKKQAIIVEREKQQKTREQNFVQSVKAENDIYLEAGLNGALGQAGSALFGGLALTGWIIVFIYPFMENHWGSFFWISLTCSIGLTMLAIRSYKRGKGELRVLKSGKNSIKIEMKFKNQNLIISSPIRCEFYADKTQNSVNGINTTSYFTLYMIFHTDCGKRINIFESLGLGGEVPPGWEFVSFDDPRKQGDYGFSYKRNSPMKLKKLKLFLNQYLINE